LGKLESSLQNLKSKLRALPAAGFSRQSALSPRLYNYTYEEAGERSRIHLRVDEDGRGILLVNASRVMHLNPTAALMAYLALQKVSEDKAVRVVMHRYDVSVAQAYNDYAQFCLQLGELIRPDGACPVHELELDVTLPFSARPSAPYRMDLALTYRCNDDCAHCYNARPRDYPECSTDQWKTILDRLWEAGIPHIVFTGGEPTLREDLPELIAYAGRNGQITGMNTNARRLHDASYLSQLVDAGLDHVQITVESHDPGIHDRMVRSRGAWKQTISGLRNALDTPLYVMTNTTMLRENSPQLEETLNFLAELGVPTVGLNALIYSGKGRTVGTGLSEADLPPLLDMARQRTESAGQKLIWYTPTQYCSFDPMQLELGVKGCTAALYNMCVEPDGAVIPCQSYYQPVGNMLADPWNSIWNNDLCIWLRERRYMPDRCTGCALVAECGGGCPLTLDLDAKV
jgi:radical SAM protein with 4Fe4S-binding SPASM domain